MSRPCYLYHICRVGDKWDFTKGYIGISTKPSQRWKSGYSNNPHLRSAMKKYNDIIKYIVTFGSLKRCLKSELILRPDINMGWNIAKGGGLPPSPKGRPHCISNLPPEKRRKDYTVSDLSRLRMSISQQKVAHLNSKRMTENNPMSGMSEDKHPDFKGWFVTPAGRFGSATAAAVPNGVSRSIIQKRCTDGAFIQRARMMPKEMLGKTWRELGWYFEESVV